MTRPAARSRPTRQSRDRRTGQYKAGPKRNDQPAGKPTPPPAQDSGKACIECGTDLSDALKIDDVSIPGVGDNAVICQACNNGGAA